jgi:glycine/D-amino acid oxidase-like deaminating enzyme
LTAVEIPRPARRSWWLEEALARPEFAGPETPPLARDTTADVMILGGGYTGMWTAWFLKQRQPDLDVVLLEGDICGGGPSGRNGGFVNGLYDEADVLIARHGDEGRRTVEMAARSIDEIGSWCEATGVDAWYEPSGDLGVSTNPTHDVVVGETVAEAERLGFGEVYRPLSPGDIRARFDSPVVRTGFLVTHAATVQPARLARGLRAALIERGVRIFEGTPVLRLNARRPQVQTPGGAVRAGRAILGLNAWARPLRGFRRSLFVRGTYIVITAPAPDRLRATRWTGGEGVYDLRTSLHYLRTTRDGRIAFGGSSLRISRDPADSPRFAYDEGSASTLARDLRRWFPAFAGVPLEAAWGGPIDVSGLHLPFFGTLPGGVTHFGLGFTGNGVGPCHLGGKILAGLALGTQDEAATLAISDGDRMRFPPEPWFSIGERAVGRAIIRRDDRLDEGRPPGFLTDGLARLPRRLGYNLGP